MYENWTEWLSGTRVPYLNSMEGDIIYVVDNSQEAVRETNKCSSKQKDKVVLIEPHLRNTAEDGKTQKKLKLYKSTEN